MPVSALADSRTLHATTPDNLPRLQPFFNRSKELMQIREALDPSSPAWGVHIDGPGGRGKTSLAVRAANDCPPDRFQQFIFLSVKDREMKEGGDHQVTAGSLIRLARAVLAGYDFLEAETLSREALRLSEEIRRQEFIADSCEVLAKSLLRGGKTPEALDCGQRAIDRYHRLYSPKAEDAARTLRACQE